MYGRTEDIIEMQEGNLVDDIESACSIENIDDDNMPYTTLISKYFLDVTLPCNSTLLVVWLT